MRPDRVFSGDDWTKTDARRGLPERRWRSDLRKKPPLDQSCLPPRSHWQYRAPFGLPSWSCRFETQLRVDRDGSFIVRVRIGSNHRCAFLKKRPHSHSDKRGSMADADHSRVSDELVNSSRPFGKTCKMVVLPSVHSVVLHERERPLCARNDPTGDPRISQISFVIRLIRVPPFADVRVRLPCRKQSEIIQGRSAKTVLFLRNHPTTLAHRALVDMRPGLRSKSAAADSGFRPDPREYLPPLRASWGSLADRPSNIARSAGTWPSPHDQMADEGLSGIK